MALGSSPVKRFATYPAVAVLVLGGLWFLCGFFGPIFLAPDANQGPLLGIFFTGPLGVATGIAVGLIAAAFSTPFRLFGAALAALALVGSGVVLYASLPEDLYEGVIIDASIRGCGLPRHLFREQSPNGRSGIRKRLGESPALAGRPTSKECYARNLQFYLACTSIASARSGQ